MNEKEEEEKWMSISSGTGGVQALCEKTVSGKAACLEAESSTEYNLTCAIRACQIGIRFWREIAAGEPISGTQHGLLRYIYRAAALVSEHHAGTESRRTTEPAAKPEKHGGYS